MYKNICMLLHIQITIHKLSTYFNAPLYFWILSLYFLHVKRWNIMVISSMLIRAQRFHIIIFWFTRAARQNVTAVIVCINVGIRKASHLQTLKRKCFLFDEMFTMYSCTGSCRFDNFQCGQWWKFRQNDISVSGNKLSTHPSTIKNSMWRSINMIV